MSIVCTQKGNEKGIKMHHHKNQQNTKGSMEGNNKQKTYKTNKTSNKMIIISLLITLNVSRLTPQSKDIDWQNGLKKKDQLCAVYRRLNLDLRTHRLKVKG